MKVIRHDPPAGSEYMKLAYPRPGLYFVQRLSALILVDVSGGVRNVGPFYEHEMSIPVGDDGAHGVITIDDVRRILNDRDATMLKAIAVAKDPKLLEVARMVEAMRG